MCGNHAADGTPVDHDHDHDRNQHGRVLRPSRFTSRRAFLGEFGAGAIAVAVFTPGLLAACSSDDADGSAAADAEAAPLAATSPPAAEQPTSPPDPTAAPAATSPPDPASTDTPEPAAPAVSDLTWARAQLGSVSAYVLARGNTAAIVDTGNPGSAQAIGETLGSLGLNYNDVAHVILTHHHPDHAGSIGEVLDMAVNATAYAGEEDLGRISVDTITGLVGGEDIFGFEVLATPGHTAGHMSVIDHDAGLLVAGDALWTGGGQATEGPERFTSNLVLSRRSIRAISELSFNTLLVGHGDPLEEDADALVAALVASL